jgi:hypothetical protein
LLFGSSPLKERAEMQKELKRIVARVEKSYRRKYANITAGLGSIFVLMADRYLRPGSRLGLVLPKALLSGVAWHETRDLLKQYYRLEYLIVSQDPERWNFSESTDLSEVLLVAVKKDPAEERKNDSVIALNLWRNPTTAFEALAVTHELLSGKTPDLEKGQGALEIKLGTQKVGEAIQYPWDDDTPTCLQRSNEWILPCAYAQADIIRTASHLLQGKLWLPNIGGIAANFPICRLETFARLGSDRRDIHDGFGLSESPTAYPAFWGHDAQAIYTISQKPNRYLSPLSIAKAGRNLRKLEDLAPLASRILIAERLWLKTQSLISVRLDQKVLSNVWWTILLNGNLPNVDQIEKSLTIWLNSTLGLLVLLAVREETRGAWVDFKKPVLLRMPVLDLSSLASGQIIQMADAYDKLATDSLSPLPLMAEDPVRQEIDNAISKVLNLPDFSVLRELLSREPVICLKRL